MFCYLLTSQLLDDTTGSCFPA